MFSRFTLDPRHHFLLCGFCSFSSPPPAGFVTSCGSRCCNLGEYVKIMLSVWCFMVFAAVGERLAVSGKREMRERERGRVEGVWMESGSTLFLCFASTFFPLAPALFLPVVGCDFIVVGSRFQEAYWPKKALSDAVDLLHQHISIAAS